MLAGLGPGDQPQFGLAPQDRRDHAQEVRGLAEVKGVFPHRAVIRRHLRIPCLHLATDTLQALAIDVDF